MRIVRVLAATAGALTLTLAALASSTGSAIAAGPTSPTTAGAHTYSFSMPAEGSTTSTGTLAWNNTTWALSATATTGQLAAGSCVTVYFDWRSNGHHDARALRDCTSNDTYSFSFPDANTGNLLGGPSRMGLCYGKDNTVGTCTYYALGSPYIQMDLSQWPQPTWAQPCVLSWTKRSSTGAVSTFIDAHPRRKLLQGATC